MALGAIVNKSSFKTGFYAGDFTLVNVRFFLLVSRTFNIQIVELLSVNQRYAQLLFLSRVD
ncbi:hypothetical protein D3C81_616520 [compost metagenome]